MSNQLVAPPGLKGLIVADTAVGDVRGAEGFFHYRHLDAIEVARLHSYEAAAALLIDGDLPDPDSEERFRAELAAARRLDPGVLAVVTELARRAPSSSASPSPLAGLRAVISVLADDTPSIDVDPAERRHHALQIAGAAPAVLAAFDRIAHGAEPVPAAEPGLSLGLAADYVRLVTGSLPTPELARAVETYMLVTADHGFNASTFTSRVITSTGASVASALAGAVAALSGPLHGGAPSRVLDMLDAIGDPSGTEAWVRSELDAGRTIMGFGHAVYRTTDPRSDLLREVSMGLGGELVDRADEIEQRMLGVLADWKPTARLATNVEYWAAVVLHLAGIPRDMFTPTFATSRMAGWVAHILEQAANNKIMRPASRYVGPDPGPAWSSRSRSERPSRSSSKPQQPSALVDP